MQNKRKIKKKNFQLPELKQQIVLFIRRDVSIFCSTQIKRK